jgi:hypothetical protein
MQATRLEAGSGYTKDGIIKVGIYETNVLGVKAYHAKCLCCDFKSKRFDKESTAVKVAKAHRCK